MSMREAVRESTRFFFSPKPSLFDFCVCIGIIPIGFINSDFQGWYLVFFSFFLICVSVARSSERWYSNIWYSLILLWAFAGIFIHSWAVNTTSVCYKYFNFYLMSEGFIYIFAGIMYVIMIAKKGVNLRLLLITIPISLIPLFKMQIYCGQMSYIFALLIGLVIYNLMNGFKLFGFVIILSMLIIAGMNFEWLLMKFECRPYVWVQMIKDICQYPLFGTGFNKLLIPDNMIWVEKLNNVEFGWLWRHNDFLSIASYLGIPILIPIGGLVVHYFNRFKHSWAIIPFASFVVVSSVQMTMFDPYKALIILTTLGFLRTEV